MASLETIKLGTEVIDMVSKEKGTIASIRHINQTTQYLVVFDQDRSRWLEASLVSLDLINAN